MSSVQDLYLENLRKSFGGELSTEAPIEVPARRIAEQSAVPVVPVPGSVEDIHGPRTGEPVPVNTPVQANKLGTSSTPVSQTRIDELERRVQVLENALRPALGKKTVSEMEQIELDYIVLGQTDISFHVFRCLPRLKRKAMLAGVA
jgi:hypothetical protein